MMKLDEQTKADIRKRGLVAMEKFNRSQGDKMPNGECPGHIGAGTGGYCCICGGWR